MSPGPTPIGSTLPPVLLLGAQETALGVMRALARHGVQVAVSGQPRSVALSSRFCSAAYTYAEKRNAGAFWGDLLLGRDNTPFEQQVVLAACDEGLEFLARNHARLSRRYRLNMYKPELHLALLDKQRNLELGRAAGVATPSFWRVEDATALEHALSEVRYPVLVKPIHSHIFKSVFNCKHFTACNADELTRNARIAVEAGVAFMICEMIPGPDSLLSSYYTYLTPSGEALFHFTKRVLRRYPINQGGATYHLTEWMPETAEAGLRFFRGIGFQGLGNVEFKLDRRDGELKLIECNARFTAAQALVSRAGVDTPWIAYCSAIGREPPRIKQYREHLCLWNPEADYQAYKQLRRAGALTTATWLRSLARRKITPYTDWSDPWPAVLKNMELLRLGLAKPFTSFQHAVRLLMRRLTQRPA